MDSADEGDDSTANDGDNTSRSSDQSKKKKSVLLSNRFEEYFNIKNNEDDGNANSSKTNNIDHNNTSSYSSSPQENHNAGIWNHFTTPLNPSRELPSQHDDDRNKISYFYTPSIFSDLERTQTFDKFANIFMERMGNVMSSGKLSAAWKDSNDNYGGGGSIFSWLLTDYSPEGIKNTTNNNNSERIDPNDYNAERNMMTPHFTPIVWGSSCMVITLLSIRTGRWYQGRYVGQTSRNIYTAKNKASSSTNSVKSIQDVRHIKQQQTHNINNPFNPQRELKNNILSSLSTLPVDLALSILVGISTTLFLTERYQLMKDFAHAPLLEGKSVLAEELCVPFSKEMKNINDGMYTYTKYNDPNSSKDGTTVEQRQVVPYSELWKDENLGEFDSLRAIRDFVYNCHEREKRNQKEKDEDSGDDADNVDAYDVFVC